MTPLSTVKVVIPYFREKEKLDLCLSHLKAQTYPHIDIFIKDNSVDNVGFTQAVNLGLIDGLKDPQVGYFLILNQDCYLEKGAIQALVAAMEANPLCGIASAIQMNEDQRITWAGSLEAFPIGNHQTTPNSSATYETFWANGACMLLRRALVQEIGLLDKNFTHICSDSDYSFTARARGWQVRVITAARAIHGLGTSAGKNSNLEIETIKLKDAFYFYEKWLSADLYKKMAYKGLQINDQELLAWQHGLKQSLAELYKLKASNQVL